MPGTWYRQRNFYKTRINSGVLSNGVTFINSAPIVLIKAISITHFKGNQNEVCILIEPSALFERTIAELVQRFFPSLYSRSESASLLNINLRFKSNFIEHFNNLTGLLSYLNKMFDKIEFPPELFAEITAISSKITTPIKSDEDAHIIPEYLMQDFETHPNPLKKKSTAVVDLFQYQSRDYIAKNLLTLRKKFRYLIQYGGRPPFNRRQAWTICTVGQPSQIR